MDDAVILDLELSWLTMVKVTGGDKAFVVIVFISLIHEVGRITLLFLLYLIIRICDRCHTFVLKSLLI